jgi:deoxyribodipyrimidine photo-lyase
MASFDVGGYAGMRSEVLPRSGRGASALSPYIRHGLLQLRTVWDHVAGGPKRDVAKFRDELLWQEYARHLYARLGSGTARPLRFTVEPVDAADTPDGMACVDLVTEELERDGWLVNQTRMWLASHWTIRRGRHWRDGEDWFYRHLLDGSRAANRLGWQWTSGMATGRSYGFSRHQVERRAPGLCAACLHRDRCPIEDWPVSPIVERIEADPAIRSPVDDAAGPLAVVRSAPPDVVWITAESLGDGDPALSAHPALPVVFVFDEPLLRSLRLTSKRLVFLAESLADLGTRREVWVHRGRQAEVLSSFAPAVTHAPVPGFRRKRGAIRIAEVHPWPWLVTPHSRSVASFSAWRKHAVPPS